MGGGGGRCRLQLASAFTALGPRSDFLCSGSHDPDDPEQSGCRDHFFQGLIGVRPTPAFL